MVDVSFVQTEHERELVFSIRRKVFVEEQEIDETIEYDEFESSASHIIARFNGVSAGAARIRKTNNDTLKIERMAVLPEYRNRGIGGAILDFCQRCAAEWNIHTLILHAQTAVQHFYSQHGYEPRGTVFKEAGIDHIFMEKQIDESSAS